jgi:hypothetical protein
MYCAVLYCTAFKRISEAVFCHVAFATSFGEVLLCPTFVVRGERGQLASARTLGQTRGWMVRGARYVCLYASYCTVYSKMMLCIMRRRRQSLYEANERHSSAPTPILRAAGKGHPRLRLQVLIETTP